MALWAGGTTQSSERVLATDGPWSSDGLIGTIHLVPPASRRETTVAVRAVMGIGRDPVTCGPQSSEGCVVAERTLRYVEHEQLTVPIGLYRACAGVVCASGLTCNSRGACVSSELDQTACLSDDGCILPGDPASPPGVQKQGSPVGPPVTPVPPPEPLKAPTVAFYDAAPQQGLVQGVVTIRNADPRPVAAYELRWSTRSGGDAGLLAMVPSTGTETKFSILESRAPTGAEFLRVTALGYDERLRAIVSPATALRGDNFVRQRDVGVGAGGDAIVTPVVLHDDASSKVLVVAADVSGQISLRRCEDNGTNCVGRLLDPSSQARMRNPAAALRTQGQHKALVVAGVSTDGTSALIVLRCALDGTNCARQTVPLGPGHGPSSIRYDVGATISASDGATVITAVARRVAAIGSDLEVIRCLPDGSPCTTKAMLTQQSLYNLQGTAMPSAEPGVVYVSALRFAAAAEAILARCDLAAPSCTTTTLPYIAGDIEGGVSLSSSIDPDAKELFLAEATETNTLPAGAVQTWRCSFGGALTCATTGQFAAPNSSGLLRTAWLPADNKTPDERIGVVFLGAASGYNVFRCPTKSAGYTCSTVPTGGAFGVEGSGLSVVSTRTTGAEGFALVARNLGAADVPVLLRCPSSFLGCGVSDVSWPEAFAGSVDAASRLGLTTTPLGRVLVGTTGPNVARRASLFDCDPEGDNCNHHVLDASSQSGRNAECGRNPLLLFDTARNGLTVVTSDAQGLPGTSLTRQGLPSMFVCDAAGNGCSFRSVVSGSGNPFVSWPAARAAFSPEPGRRIYTATALAGNLVVGSCTSAGGDCRREPAQGTASAVDVDATGAFFAVQRTARIPAGFPVETCSLATGACTGVGAVDTFPGRQTKVELGLVESGTRVFVLETPFGGGRAALTQLPASGPTLLLNIGGGGGSPTGSFVVDEIGKRVYLFAGDS